MCLQNNEIDIASIPSEADIEPPFSSVPEDASPHNIFEVSSPITPHNSNAMNTHVIYTLPFRNNRGKPPNRYSPDIMERRSKYPIANYVSTKRLSEPLKTFVHELSTYWIPTSTHEALTNPK